MKLIGSLTSPYVRKIRIVLAEKKIDYEFVLDSPWEAGNQVAALNPLGKVPVLILDDDSTLFDSRVIAEYLDAVAPNNRLIPASGRERISVKRWEALADGIMDSAVAVRNESLRPAEKQEAGNIKLHYNAVTRALAYAADQLGAKQWCEGASVTLADLAMASALVYLDLRQADRDWRGAHPNLAAWFARMSERASLRATLAG